jgi:hypothetical protein
VVPCWSFGHVAFFRKGDDGYLHCTPKLHDPQYRDEIDRVLDELYPDRYETDE